MRVHDNLVDAVEHMPEESVLVLEDVSWEEYEQLLETVPEGRPFRVTYDCGRLEVVTTSRRHEWRSNFIHSMIVLLCVELKTAMESFGHATWKRKGLRKGAEADTCFYIASAPFVTDRDSDVDLEADPPPDIVIEIDVSNQSDHKFPIYAAFRVPEIWRFKKGRMEFHQLHDETYIESTASRFFPFLTSDVVTEFLKKARVEGQIPALAAFRRWVRKHRRRQ
jgi:Uma2 family endonuclease